MDTAAENPTPPDAEPSLLRELFGIDLRSMALLRFSFGLIIIIDLIDRARSLTMHYTEDGILTGAMLTERLNDLLTWFSVYFYIDHNPVLTGLMFVVQGIFAFLLLIGWRTRLMTIITWYLLASLHARNPILLHSGDRLLLIMIFWSVFLPMGARWSIDSAVNTARAKVPRDNVFLSMGSAAALLQIVFVYIFAIGARITPEAVSGKGFLDWWRGDAVYYTMNLDLMGTPLAGWFREYPGLMKLSTYITLAIEGIGPFLLFIPSLIGPIRIFVVAAFIGMHLGFGAFIYIGTFAFIDIAVWFLFLPPLFWNIVFRLLRTPARLGLRIYYDGTCGFCRRMVSVIHSFFLLPETFTGPAQEDPAIHAVMQEQNSWVIVDHENTQHTGFRGLLVVLRRSPVAFWLGWLLSIPPIPAIGESIYRYIANHRHGAGWALAWMRPRPVRLRTPLPVSIFIGVLVIYVLMWNISELPWPQAKPVLSAKAKIPGKMLRLNQYWGMFSPQPSHRDSWFIFDATLKDGSQIDISTREPIILGKPAAGVPSLYDHYRTMIYLFLSDEPEAWGLYEQYARHLTWKWNNDHPPEQHVQHVRVWTIIEPTPTPQQAAAGYADPLIPVVITQYDADQDVATITTWDRSVDRPNVPPSPWGGGDPHDPPRNDED